MTNEEAIYHLGWLTATTNDEKDLEAIRMAIEALKTVEEREDGEV